MSTKIAVNIAVYNEESTIGGLIENLLVQTLKTDEIVIVDDGSTDKTAKIIKQYAKCNNQIKYYYQKNAGPAAARNIAWKNSNADICVFTDGDCKPNKDWLEKLIAPFENLDIAAAGGTYRTLNENNLLAKFIGLEIESKYRNVKGCIDAHGSYNLAIKKNVLQEFNGFDERYKFPSGEDWDLTYKISNKYKIIFVPLAIVGHYHPENLKKYLLNQFWRAFDRVKLYRNHPTKTNGDVYTPWYIKFQIASSAIFILMLPLNFFIRFDFIYFLIIFMILIRFSCANFNYYLKIDKRVALYSIFVQFFRGIFWAAGLLYGVCSFLKKR